MNNKTQDYQARLEQEITILYELQNAEHKDERGIQQCKNTIEFYKSKIQENQ